MAILHAWSGGSSTAPYNTWAKAHTDFEVALGATSAGDTLYAHSGDAFTVSGAQATLTNGGTHASPVIILSVDKTSGTTDGTDCTYTPGASFKTTGGSYHINFYDKAISFGVDYVSSSNIVFIEQDGVWSLNDCQVGTSITSTAGLIQVKAQESIVSFDGVEFTFGNSAQGVQVGSGNKVVFRNCTIDGAGTAPDQFIKSWDHRGGNIIIENCDFSNLATSAQLTSAVPIATQSQGATLFFSNIKLPTSGTVTAQSITSRQALLEARGCSAGDNPNALHILQYEGVATDDAATYLDTDNAWSLKVEASSNSLELYYPCRVLLASVYAAANATIRVEGLVDLVTLPNDDEIWIEIEYPDATVTNWNKTVSTRGPINAAPTILDASGSVTWVEALTNNNEFFISQTLTSGAGMHNVYVNVANSSGLTAWFDSKVLVT